MLSTSSRSTSRALLLLVLAAPMLGGCFKHSVRDERKEPGPRATHAWKPYVIVGLAPLGKSTLSASCPSGIALYESRTSFANGLVAALTFNVFTPITVAYACAAGEPPADGRDETPARGIRTSEPRRNGHSQPTDEIENPTPDEEPYEVPIL